MTRKSSFCGLSLVAIVFLVTSSFSQTPCDMGINVHYVGIGSPEQSNTLAYGALMALQALPTYKGTTNFWGSNSAAVADTRIGGALTNNIDQGLGVWVIYDSGDVCNVYVGYQADSAMGVRDFYCYQKVPAGYVGVQAACYGWSPNGGWVTGGCARIVPGLDCTAIGNSLQLPATIQAFLIHPPTPEKVNGVQQPPLAYCGQSPKTNGGIGSNTQYCYFNAAPTDFRPEDALYATTLALSSYNSTNGLSGLGYGSTACSAKVIGNAVQGCNTFDSFQKGGVSRTLEFALAGVDPYTDATVPTGTTLTVGASPIVVFVSNADSTNSLGFGIGQPTNYLHKNVLHKVLAQIFEGVDSCTGDLLSTVNPTSGSSGGSIPGSGQPIQAVLREPLSGIYNVFEFTVVRTLSGSAATAVGQNKITNNTWMSDDESGQELDVRGTLPKGPATTYAGPGCGIGGPDGTATCGDPLWYPTANMGTNQGSNPCPATAINNGKNTNPSIKVRAVRNVDEVNGALGLYNNLGGQPTWVVMDGIGYAFWSYSNFQPGATGCPTGATSSDVTCANSLGHYLTVDGVDPLFATAGGAGWPTTPFPSQPENPSGAYNFPQCGIVSQPDSNYTLPCQQLPFTHLYDGTYPLWSMLRVVTFANVAPTAGEGGHQTPEGVINVVGYAMGQASQLSDFAPFLSNIKGLPYNQSNPNAACGAGGNPACPTGNLNLGVFRSHYEQSLVTPNNGHSACAPAFNFTSVPLQGGSASPTCLVDKGGDMGGSVKTVQDDVDFSLELGGAAINGVHYPNEIYNLRQ
jgi:hypothetical protein